MLSHACSVMHFLRTSDPRGDSTSRGGRLLVLMTAVSGRGFCRGLLTLIFRDMHPRSPGLEL